MASKKRSRRNKRRVLEGRHSGRKQWLRSDSSIGMEIEETLQPTKRIRRYSIRVCRKSTHEPKNGISVKVKTILKIVAILIALSRLLVEILQ